MPLGGPVLGATIDGYACEGGYDVPDGPATSFCAAQSLGRCRASRASDTSFRRLCDVVAVLAGLGFGELRITAEWARLEPRPGLRDADALAEYRQVIDAARAHGMHVDVLLCDAVWPSWLGHEPWLSSWAPERFAEHAGFVAGTLGGSVRTVLTLRRPHEVAQLGWVSGARPPFRRRALADAASALDGLLLAHQLATDAVASAAPTVRRGLVVGLEELDGPRGEFAGAGARRRLPRSAPRWAETSAFERWLVADVATLGVAMHAGDPSRPVEFGAGASGWRDSLVLLAQRVGSWDGSLHLRGALGAAGPLDEPRGLLDADSIDDPAGAPRLRRGLVEPLGALRRD